MGCGSWVSFLVFERCFGRTVRVLGRGHLADIVSVLKATLSVTVVLIIVLRFRVGLINFQPRSGQSEVLCVVKVQTSSQSDRAQGSATVSSNIIGRYLCPLRAPRTIATVTDNGIVISLSSHRLFRRCIVGCASPNF